MANLSNKAYNKEKFIIEDQYKYLVEKGISFNHINDIKAKSILSNNSYYYKVTAFRKNYSKNATGKYINLDFGNLNDLATIDMYFRYLILGLTLDIEHSLKSKLIYLITSDPTEDGYTIVDEFNLYVRLNRKSRTTRRRSKFRKNLYKDKIKVKQRRNITDQIINRNSNVNDYSYDLYSKRKDKPAIWVLIELMSYGELNTFIEFYVRKKKSGFNSLKAAQKLLKSTKKMRNAAAHSRGILINLVNGVIIKGVPIQVKTFARKLRINDSDINKYFRNVKIHDFCAILILHETYVISDLTKRNRKKELFDFAQRCKKNEGYYSVSSVTHNELKNIFRIFVKLIDGYNK